MRNINIALDALPEDTLVPAYINGIKETCHLSEFELDKLCEGNQSQEVINNFVNTKLDLIELQLQDLIENAGVLGSNTTWKEAYEAWKEGFDKIASYYKLPF